MAKISELPAGVRAFVSSYGWQHIDPVPWAVPAKRLNVSRIGLVVTACMTLSDQAPFQAEQPENDASIRVVPSQTDPDALVNTFAGQAFDHAGLRADANLLVPLDRLHELAAAGEIGEVSPRTVSLCGHLPKPRKLMRETAPEVAQMFVEDGADAVLLTDSSVDIYNPKVVRSTAGSLFHLPVVTGMPVGSLLDRVRAAGLALLAADGSGDRVLGDAADNLDGDLLARPHAWVMGNEAWGLEPEVRAACDAVVRVPIYGKAESLNLAMAATLCLYQSARVQKRSGIR